MTFKWTNKGVLKAAGENTLKRIAAEVHAHAVAIAPQDTGTLARSITVRRVNESRYLVGTNVFYAPFVEYGTRRMAAQPFLGPALAAVARRYT